MNRIAFAVASLSLALVACRGDDGPSGDDTMMIDAPAVVGEVTIQEVQNDAMPSGTGIELKGVVVTAIDSYGNRTGDFFVSEPGGGPNSGVKVFGAPLDQVAAIAVGDIVDITGAIKHEACNAAAPCGTVVFENNASITEVMGATVGSLVVTKTGTGTAPPPAEVDVTAIAALPTPAARDAEWEKWEGVLVKVTKARQLSIISTFGSTPAPDATEFRITGVARVQSALVELPTTSTAGTCYTSITGVADFFFNYIVAPRSAADLVGGGTGCNPMVESIAALQTATTPPEFVKLTDVFVTAVTFNKKNFWVSTSLTAAPGEGVQVFRGTGMTTPDLPADVVVGAKVTVLGAGAEFNNDANGDTITQITGSATTVTAGAPGTVVPVTNPPTITMLNAAATGEQYEGVLIRLSNVKVTTLGVTPGFVSTMTAAGGITFKADDDVYRFVAADNNVCYSSITGIWSYNAFDNTYVFAPRAATATTPDAVLAPSQTPCN